MEARKRRCGRPCPGHRGVPAMEPGHGGQEESETTSRPPTRSTSRNGAWPWRPGRAAAGLHPCRRRAPRNGAWPWRPGRAGVIRARRCRGPRSRNGAWPWRPGRVAAISMARVFAARPQWSLAMEARKRAVEVPAVGADFARNGAWPWRPGRASSTHTTPNASGTPQWSLAMEARKRRGRLRRPSHAPSTRNGAWPWRPGRDDRPGLRLQYHRPQWSLAMEARKRSEISFSFAAAAFPQWSLAMEARKRCGVHGGGRRRRPPLPSR